MAKHWDQSNFRATLAKYLEVNKKHTLPSIMNTKGYFVARAATWFTKKTLRPQIESSLGRIVSVNKLVMNKKTGKTKMGKVKELVIRKNNSQSGAPLAALIIQSRRAYAGKRSLFYRKKRATGLNAMRAAVKKMINLRIKSIAFLKSGWLPAIKKLAPLAIKSGSPQIDSSAKQIGRAKGNSTPAKEGWNPACKIENTAFVNRSQQKNSVSRSRAMRVAAAGLKAAFENETKSMNKYIEERMAKEALKFNNAQKL